MLVVAAVASVAWRAAMWVVATGAAEAVGTVVPQEAAAISVAAATRAAAERAVVVAADS